METCERCLKVGELCVCDDVSPLPTRHRVLILQHPQEPDKDLGSARLAHLALPESRLRIGLSWANLRSAWGADANPSRWAVLYLGSGVKEPAAKGPAPLLGPDGRPIPSTPGPDAPAPAPRPRRPERPPLLLVDKKGAPLRDGATVLRDLDGIVVLDGTWSQAKALWWRNAWLLKLRRAVLTPNRRSMYRELRREPRREALSTIESIGLALTALGEPPEVEEGLRTLFQRLLDAARARGERPAPPEG